MPETAFKLGHPAENRRFEFSGQHEGPPKALSDRHRPATLAEVVGQGEIVFRLQAFLEAPYSAAFLFEGPTGVGKTTVALAIAAELGAVEFGGLEVIKSGSQDGEAVEAQLRSLSFTPMLGSGWKVAIVDEADYMSPKARQLWLSALEELPSRSVIIFTTNHPEKFEQRFLDRCERFAFASKAREHGQDAQALIDSVWSRELGGRIDSPRFDALKGVVDASGHLSYRRVIRALEPLIASARRNPEPVAPEPTPDAPQVVQVIATNDPPPAEPFAGAGFVLDAEPRRRPTPAVKMRAPKLPPDFETPIEWPDEEHDEEVRIWKAVANLPRAYRLKSKPHPWHDDAQRGRTLWDWAKHMLHHGDRAGKTNAARVVEFALAECRFIPPPIKRR